MTAAAELPSAPVPALSAPESTDDSSSSAMPAPAAEPATAADSTRKEAPRRVPVPHTAGIYDVTIEAGQVAPPQNDRQKIVSSLRNSVSPFALAGEIIAASYSQATNGSPNFGSGALAFGSRVGAAAARGTSQKIFSDGVLASALHEDSRYYQLGPTHTLVNRLGYAISRPLVTRTDSGHLTPNISVLGGYLGAAYLTRTYNPVLNQSNTEVLKIYGTSLGGSALGFAVSEFLPSVLAVVHLQHVKFLQP